VVEEELEEDVKKEEVATVEAIARVSEVGEKVSAVDDENVGLISLWEVKVLKDGVR